MELDEALRRRHMCRSFRAAPVSSASVDAVVAAAGRGPSAGNTWAIDVVVLDDAAAVDGYWATTLPGGADDFAWPGLLRAPVLLVPYVDPAAYVARYARPDKSHTGLGGGPDAWSVPYWWVDGGAAVMAMLLVAAAEGLGACFFGQFDHEAGVARRLGVPEGRRALGTVALGHPDGDDRPSASARRGRPGASDFRHAGRW